MHEYTIVATLIDQAIRSASHRPIRRIHVALGECSDVTAESLRFCFERLQSGTAAAEAELVLRIEPGRARCLNCGRETSPVPENGACPSCGSFPIRVIGGSGLALEAVDVD